MMATSISNRTSSPHQDNWQKQTNVVTHNDVIDAYLMGKDHGRNEMERVLKSVFRKNLDKAKSISEAFHKEVAELGFKLNSIHLKADEITSFIVLIICSQEDYVKDDFLKAFTAARRLKKENDQDDFSISFTFTYKADTLNERCLDSDGFFLKYGHK